MKIRRKRNNLNQIIKMKIFPIYLFFFAAFLFAAI